MPLRVNADTALTKYQFNIPRQRADVSLIQFAEQADVTLLFPLDKIKDKQANSLFGAYSINRGLKILLNQTGLIGEISGSGQLVISQETSMGNSELMNNYKKSKISGAILSVLSTMAVANAAEQQENKTNLVDEQVEVIEVKGFRGSLNKALLNKRASVNSMESISAEDMGKFPDLNIAESLQRIPGVAISREGGEGRRITLRGLGPDFTRATLNGMEIPATTDELDSSISPNSGGRAFEFNIFASELFNRVDVQKSPTASMEEGGIAGTVDLYSAKPFDDKGFHVALSGQGSYNDVSKSTDPRFALLVSNTFADDTIGALFSVAYSDRSVNQEGFGTVAWQQPIADNTTFADTTNTIVNGTPNVGSCELAGAPVNPVNCLWTPRLPRADFFGNEQNRIGLTTSLQYAPNKDVELTFDYLHSELDNQRAFYNFYEMFRNYFNQLTPVEIDVHPNGKQVVAGTYDGLTGRVESRDATGNTEFDQFVFSGKFTLSERLYADTMIGYAKSDFEGEQFRHIMDTIDTHRASFDFSANANVADMDYSYNYNDSALFSLKSFDGRTEVTKENTTAKVDFTYEADDVTIKTGVAYNDRTVDTKNYGLDTFERDSALGFTEQLPADDYGSGFDGEIFSFTVADFDKVKAEMGTINWQPQEQKNTKVNEETLAAYLEFNNEYDLGDMVLSANYGVRYVKTDATSTGYIKQDTVTPVVAVNDYSNFLPSLNLALDVNDETVVRLGITKSMTRPSLTKLNPGNPNFRYIEGFVTVGNPYLKPYVSNNIDLGIEWYFEDEALLAANVFYKDVETYIRSTQEDKLIDSIYHAAIGSDNNYDPSISVNPYTEQYTHFSSANKEGTVINGLELTYQQPFDFLPGLLSNTGVVSNYTRVSSGEIVGVSKHSYNVTFYYEAETYGARISVNSRDDYFVEVPGWKGNAQMATTGPTHVDFSSFYNVNEQITLSLEVINLTDEYSRLFSTGDGSLDLMREYNHSGRQFFLGARYNY